MPIPTQPDLDFICLIAANMKFQLVYCKRLPTNAGGEIVWAWREMQMAISWANHIAQRMIEHNPLLVIPVVTYTDNLIDIQESTLDNIEYLNADISLAILDCKTLQTTLSGWSLSGVFFPLRARLRQAQWWLNWAVDLFNNP